ncbi:MAG: hypothetical protein WBA99_05745, partial [Nodosilinea sp.]
MTSPSESPNDDRPAPADPVAASNHPLPSTNGMEGLVDLLADLLEGGHLSPPPTANATSEGQADPDFDCDSGAAAPESQSMEATTLSSAPVEPNPSTQPDANSNPASRPSEEDAAALEQLRALLFRSETDRLYDSVHQLEQA